jgi:hypothetical protein
MDTNACLFLIKLLAGNVIQIFVNKYFFIGTDSLLLDRICIFILNNLGHETC